jgi:hypothetical protein
MQSEIRTDWISKMSAHTASSAYARQGGQPVVCICGANRTAIGLWETFQLVHDSDGSVSLKAMVNNAYVCAENAGAQPLIANRAAIGTWEKFDLINAASSAAASRWSGVVAPSPNCDIVAASKACASRTAPRSR